jgi:hypothetical protein
MVQLGSIYSGGREGHPISGTVYNSGVCFSLNSTSELDKICSIDNGLWEVEIKKGQSTIVARCRNIIPPDEVFKYGFESNELKKSYCISLFNFSKGRAIYFKNC